MIDWFGWNIIIKILSAAKMDKGKIERSLSSTDWCHSHMTLVMLLDTQLYTLGTVSQHQGGYSNMCTTPLHY